MVLSRNTKEHLEKDSKELSYISNMNFELQNSVDWLTNRLDTTAERTEEIIRKS